MFILNKTQGYFLGFFPPRMGLQSSLGVSGIVLSERDADEEVEAYIVWMITDLAALIKENIRAL